MRGMAINGTNYALATTLGGVASVACGTTQVVGTFSILHHAKERYPHEAQSCDTPFFRFRDAAFAPALDFFVLRPIVAPRPGSRGQDWGRNKWECELPNTPAGQKVSPRTRAGVFNSRNVYSSS